MQYVTITLEAAQILVEKFGEWFRVDVSLSDEFFLAKDCNNFIHILHKEDVIVQESSDGFWEEYCKEW
jgi:hypothetical protein